MEDALHDAFVDDHQRLIRGLGEIRRALHGRETSRAVRLARTLDQDVGPHVEFEESVFYPRLRPLLGAAFIDQLYAEHQVGQDTIRHLLKLDPEGELTQRECDALIAKIDSVLEHALSCGTLLSHLDALDAGQRETLLETLLTIRERRRKWTDLATRVAASHQGLA